jgi:phosphatidylglycerophosphate synthase
VTSGVESTRAGAADGARAGATGARPGATIARRTQPGQPTVSVAVVMATAGADDGGPAAALQWEGGTVLSRLLEQLSSLAVASVHVITRPEWEDLLRPAVSGLGEGVTLTASPGVADDLRLVSRIARRGGGGIVVANGDIVTHREALAGLLADPRVPTGMLATAWQKMGRPYAFRVRSTRGRVVSAASPYHYVHKPNNTFLGVLRVAEANRPLLADLADRLAELTGDLREEWQRELDRKAGNWRARLAYATLRGQAAEDDGEPDAGGALVEADAEAIELDAGEHDDPFDAIDPATIELPPEVDAELSLRVGAAPRDVPALLMVALVRSGVHLGQSFVRKLFWARPLSHAGIERAEERIARYDEDKVLLDSAVKASDGFFTTFFVSPYSKYIARWAARRGFTPNQITTVSLFIGLLSAIAFATGERAGLIAGAVLLQLAFTTDCVDGQLARYTRTFSKLGAWLDSIFDRSKEYLAFAGLAIGASRAGDPVWLLAGAALTLQTVRHAFDFSFGAAQHQVIGAAPQQPLENTHDRPGHPRPPAGEDRADTPAPAAEVTSRSAASGGQSGGPPPDGLEPRRALPLRVLGMWRKLDKLPGITWLKRIVAFPIGERFAVISITAAVSTPRTTFVVVIAWGSFAAAYSLAGRLLRTVAR